jgi:hypothetical protein
MRGKFYLTEVACGETAFSSGVEGFSLGRLLEKVVVV